MENNRRGLKIALYVHDLKLEIGHSNSLIELIRHLPQDIQADINEIELVSYSTSPIELLFPKMKCKIRHVKVPLQKIRPVLLKSIFFQLWTFIYNKFFQEKGFTRIGIGISSLSVDYVSIQFIHHQWTDMGLQLEKPAGIRKFYKKVLFYYFEKCERYLFSKKGLKVFSPAEFLTKYLKKEYPQLIAETIYSGVNLSRFQLAQLSKKEILDKLMLNEPILRGLDLEQPIVIFVGAYERKGIFKALELLSTIGNIQFIVIGSPSSGNKVTWPSNVKIFPIKFTRQVQDFYSISDLFLFPTIYEPFGLVLFEAMAMGLPIVTRWKDVGASELLEKLPEVYFLDKDNFSFPTLRVLSLEERTQLKLKRLSMLGDVSWSKSGEDLAKFLLR